MRTYRHARSLIASLVLVALSAQACSVPVFRYALERFEASPYRVVIYHRGPLTARQEEYAAALKNLGEGNGPQVNICVQRVDLAQPPDPERAPDWTPPPETPLPLMVVAYPNGKLTAPAWSGPLDADAARGLFDSPARREIAARLLKGDTAVFLLLQSGRKDEDAAAAEVLKKALPELEKTLKLPDPDGPGQLLSALPLRIAFSSVTVSEDDPAEKLFAHVLIHAREDPKAERKATVYPVFGRGRALAELTGEKLTAEAFTQVGEFLCGECMCTYKEQMPGLDLLIAADWEALGTDKAVQDMPVLLRGLSPLAQAAAGLQTPPAVTTVPSARMTTLVVALPMRLYIVLGGAVLLVLLLSLLISRKGGG